MRLSSNGLPHEESRVAVAGQLPDALKITLYLDGRGIATDHDLYQASAWRA
jgi:hypothetical protein